MTSTPGTPELADAHRSGCESCGMPIETGRYCQYCTDAEGNLQSFDERFARMVDWQTRRRPGAPRAQVEAETLAYLATMPAWRAHPAVIAAGASPTQSRRTELPG